MDTETKRSDHNPFRTPTVTPNPTGAGPSHSPAPRPLSPQHPQPSLLSASTSNPTSETRQSLEPRERQRAPSPTESLTAALGGTSLDVEATPEPPPAYTPAANYYTGEATVEYGPTRPFQQAPPAPPLPQQFSGLSVGPFTPQSTGISPMPTGWARYPGQGPRQSGPPFVGPPPRHPSIAGPSLGPIPGPNANTEVPPLPRRPLSDFARDFYAAGADDQTSGRPTSPTSSDDDSGPEHYERNHSSPNSPVSSRIRTPTSPNASGPTGTTQYSPPSQPPPPPRRPAPSSGRPSTFAPPSGPPPSQSQSPRRAEANNEDWKPTTTPTPGRPLLNNGHVLVYPAGHECRKCLNTGYKNFDPSHPCRKCWTKYGKPYSGPIVHAPQSPQSQRPLPTFRPPHLRHRHSSSQPSLLSPPAQGGGGFSRTPSVSRVGMMPGGYPGRAVSNPGPFTASPPPPPPGPPPSISYTRDRPPPGATVVHPGDSRIGGRLCWRCGGDGTVSFLIFDVTSCPVCNGIGRTFN